MQHYLYKKFHRIGAKLKNSNKNPGKGKNNKTAKHPRKRENHEAVFYIYIKKTWVFANFANTLKEAK
jgi:hypothetical protein